MAADDGALPSREELLAFVAECPGRVGKRDIARAFGIAGSARRAALGRLLGELRHEGLLAAGRGRRLQPKGALPSEAAVEVVALDDEGNAVAEPVCWRGEGPPPRIVLTSAAGRRPLPAPGIGERAIARLRPLPGGGWQGRVRRLLPTVERQAVGVFRRTARGERIQPADRRQAHDWRAVVPQGLTADDGDLVLVEPLSQRRFGPVPARVLRRLGHRSDPGAASLLAIAAHGIPTAFADAALAEARAAQPVAGARGREDLRPLPLVTIDDDDARDHDDAVFAEAGDGAAAWHAVVAIADVAHYVRPGSALDRTARQRGNSVYFPDRVVAMLPERLSNDLCSLLAGRERPCIAVHLWIGGDGTLIRWRFARALMRSAARLSYDDVQAHRDGTPGEATARLPAGLIGALYGAYEALRQARERRGALDIERPERRVTLQDDGGVEVTARKRHASHRLIEELMIAANVAAARTLEAKRMPVMYRLHDRPSPEKADELRGFLESLGLSLRRSPGLRPGDFAQVLKRAGASEHRHAIHEAVLRSQAQAEYGPERIGHFGLALTAYSHFTSPIRRYADLVVHRSLIAALGLGDGGPAPGADFEELGAHLTATERRAMRAERETVDRYLARCMADRIGAVMAGRVCGLGRFGLIVRLDGLEAEGLLPARRLPGGPFRFDERRRSLRGRGVAWRLGDAVTVAIAEANPVSGAVIFELASCDR